MEYSELCSPVPLPFLSKRPTKKKKKNKKNTWTRKFKRNIEPVSHNLLTYSSHSISYCIGWLQFATLLGVGGIVIKWLRNFLTTGRKDICDVPWIHKKSKNNWEKYNRRIRFVEMHTQLSLQIKILSLKKSIIHMISCSPKILLHHFQITSLSGSR